ncbi:hypothetical protein [uncultured Methanobrevibacter sp.]|nr:hypothetical protein [uncultured Methanobrevibacter sp.]
MKKHYLVCAQKWDDIWCWNRNIICFYRKDNTHQSAVDYDTNLSN